MSMERVKGVAGVFVYSSNPERLTAWYRDNLGVESANEIGDGVSYHEFLGRRIDSDRKSRLTWSVFPRDFPGSHGAKLVYHVDDLDAVLSQLAANGVAPAAVENFDYGRFAWVRDPDGNVIGLFQDLEY